MKSHLTHTTILVNSIDSVANFFVKKNFHMNSPEIFESEGTREIYVGDNDKNSSTILLVEPSGDGPYKTALYKRGAGIHHIGLDVENLVEYCTKLGRSGWLLHTHSLRSVPTLKTAYLVRPGVPLILEVHERLMTMRSPSLLTGIGLPDATRHKAMIEILGIENAQISQSSSEDVIFETLSGSFSLQDILSYDVKPK